MKYSIWKSPLTRIGIYAAFGLAAYFINIEIQTSLGEKALAETGLIALSLDEAIAKARKENKQVLSDLSAIWCSSCRKLDKEVLSDPIVQSSISSKYVFARIEYESDEGKAFMEKYDVSGFPTLMVIDPNTHTGRRLPLTYSPEAFSQLLGEAS